LFFATTTEQGLDLVQAGLALQQPAAVGDAVDAPARPLQNRLSLHRIQRGLVRQGIMPLRIAVAGDGERLRPALRHQVYGEARDGIAHVDGILAALTQAVRYFVLESGAATGVVLRAIRLKAVCGIFEIL